MRRRQIFAARAAKQMPAEEAEKVNEPTDAELRRMFKIAFGRLPAGRMKRETMLERLNDAGNQRA